MGDMVDHSWRKVSRARLLGQPIGLGIPLAGMGGFLTFNMILATKPSEPMREALRQGTRPQNEHFKK